jgi:hypothetical protein
VKQQQQQEEGGTAAEDEQDEDEDVYEDEEEEEEEEAAGEEEEEEEGRYGRVWPVSHAYSCSNDTCVWHTHVSNPSTAAMQCVTTVPARHAGTTTTHVWAAAVVFVAVAEDAAALSKADEEPVEVRVEEDEEEDEYEEEDEGEASVGGTMVYATKAGVEWAAGLWLAHALMKQVGAGKKSWRLLMHDVLQVCAQSVHAQACRSGTRSAWLLLADEDEEEDEGPGSDQATRAGAAASSSASAAAGGSKPARVPSQAGFLPPLPGAAPSPRKSRAGAMGRRLSRASTLGRLRTEGGGGLTRSWTMRALRSSDAGGAPNLVGLTLQQLR